MRKLALLVILFPTFGASAPRDPSTSVATSLGGVLREALEKSPLLQGQAELRTAAKNDRWRRFIFNEPQFTYQNSDDGTASSFGLQLTTSFPGKTPALTTLDTARYHGQEAELQAKKYDLARIVAQSYLDCAAAQATAVLQRDTSSDLETVFQSLKALYETGHSTQAEKIGAELQARQARLDLVTAQDRQVVLCKKFERLLAEVGLQSAPREVDLPDDIDESLISKLGPQSADQNRASAAIELARATSATAWWSQLPDITLSVTRNHYLYLPGSPSGREWTFNYSASITLPLLFPFHEAVEATRTRNQATVDENSAEIQKVAADSDQADAAKEYRRDRNRLDELRARDLILAEALVESTFSAYRSGKLGFAELVLSRKTLTDLRAQDISLRVSIINAHLRCLNRCSEAKP